MRGHLPGGLDLQNFAGAAGPRVIENTDGQTSGFPSHAVEIGPASGQKRAGRVRVMSVHNVTLAMPLLELGLVALPQKSALGLRFQRLIGVHSGVHEDSLLIQMDPRQLRDELQVSRRQSSQVGRVCRVEAIRSKRLRAAVLHPPLVFCLTEASRQHHHLVIAFQDNQPGMAIRPVHDELKDFCAPWTAVDVVAQCDDFCLPTPRVVHDPIHGKFKQVCAAVDIRDRICKFNTSHCCTVP